MSSCRFCLGSYAALNNASCLGRRHSTATAGCTWLQSVKRRKPPRPHRCARHLHGGGRHRWPADFHLGTDQNLGPRGLSPPGPGTPCGRVPTSLCCCQQPGWTIGSCLRMSPLSRPCSVCLGKCVVFRPAYWSLVTSPPNQEGALPFVHRLQATAAAVGVVLVEWASSRSESHHPSGPRCRDGPTSISRRTRATSPSATTPWCAEARRLLRTPGAQHACHM